MAFDLNKNDGSVSGSSGKSPASSKFDLSKSETEEVVVPIPDGSSEVGASKSKTWIIGLFGVLVVGAGIWYYSSNPKAEGAASSVSTEVTHSDSVAVAVGDQGKGAADVNAVEDPSANQTTAVTPAVENGAVGNESAVKAVSASSSAKVAVAGSGTKDGAVETPGSSVAGSVVKDGSAGTPASGKTAVASSVVKGQSEVAAQRVSDVQNGDALNNKIPATFALGSSSLIKVDQSLVKRLKSYLAKNQGASINVNGYASSEGSLAINQTISQARADAFKKYLVSKNVEENRVVAVGKGIENPIASNLTNAGRKKNRRVEITLP